VIGIYMTPAMLAKANLHKQKMGLPNVDFRFGMIEALPVQNSSVDVIISNCVINLAPDKLLVFREAFRVLKPGGRLAISDIVTEGDLSPELRAQANKWAECISGALDVTAYIGMMWDAGFVDIQVVDKFDADSIIRREDGMPRIFSASILAQKR
jgi:ubiquinone/menaquinone biosynthesis C-methylase UbiE